MEDIFTPDAIRELLTPRQSEMLSDIPDEGLRIHGAGPQKTAKVLLKYGLVRLERYWRGEDSTTYAYLTEFGFQVLA